MVRRPEVEARLEGATADKTELPMGWRAALSACKASAHPSPTPEYRLRTEAAGSRAVALADFQSLQRARPQVPRRVRRAADLSVANPDDCRRIPAQVSRYMSMKNALLRAERLLE
jgi:hypothetical protein